MPAQQTRPFLLAYDIADPKRLSRVHRTVKQAGIPLQYSVFLLVMTAPDIDQLLTRLDALIHPKEDDIRVYPLPTIFDADQFGRQWLPAGIDRPDQASLTQALAALVQQAEAPDQDHP